MEVKKKLILIIIIILLSTSISGCWDSVELKNRQIISAIGIDKEQESGHILLTLQSIVPEKLGTPMKSPDSRGKSVHVISTSGNCISDALKLYREQISKSIYLQSNRILVIGEDIAKEGLTSILDFFLRYDESRLRTSILVCKGKASDILNWNSEEYNIPSDYILELITSYNKISPILNTDMHKLSLDIFSKTTSPVIPWLEIIYKKNSSPTLKYEGAAVFNKDKLVGWLDVNETESLLRITNQSKLGLIVASLPGIENKTLSQRLTNFKTKINPKIDNGSITISLDITEEGSLAENNSNGNINSPESIKNLEKILSKKIKKDIEACLIKIQKEYKTDVFGFGEAIHKKYPKEWKHLERSWSELYPDIKVNITVNAKIGGTGMIIDSFRK